MSIKLKSASMKAAQQLREFLDMNNGVISVYDDRVVVYIYHKFAPGFDADECVVIPDKVEHMAYLEPVNYTYPWKLDRLTYSTEDWAILATLGDNPSKATLPLIVMDQ